MPGTKVLNENAIQLGTGWFEWELYADTPAYGRLRNLGATRGPIKINPKRTTKDYEEGFPKQPVVTDVITEGCEIECPCDEITPASMAMFLGAGSVSSTTIALQQPVTDYKILGPDLGWQNLSYRGGSGSATVQGATGQYNMSTLTVVKDALTETPYAKDTDYEEDLVEGRIRRKSGGSIATPWKVKVTYTVDIPAYSKVQQGGSNSLAYYKVKHTFEHRDGKREIYFFYKVVSAGDISLEYSADDYRKASLKMKVLADPLKTSGNQLYEYRVED